MWLTSRIEIRGDLWSRGLKRESRTDERKRQYDTLAFKLLFGWLFLRRVYKCDRRRGSETLKSLIRLTITVDSGISRDAGRSHDASAS